MTELWKSCEHFLRQAIELTERLDPSHYQAVHVNCLGGSIGGHLRHCLDHFDLFRQGMEAGRIDYDARNRGTAIETDPAAATGRLKALADWCARAEGDAAQVLRVSVDCGGEARGFESDSSIGRELQFLVSHTVHHFALIAVMCANQGIELPPDFGVAPSTLRYRESLATGI